MARRPALAVVGCSYVIGAVLVVRLLPETLPSAAADLTHSDGNTPSDGNTSSDGNTAFSRPIRHL